LRDAIYRNADAVVAASPFACQNLLRIGVPAARIITLTPGVDQVRFVPGPPTQALVERFSLAGKRVLLTVARLVPRKGHRVVLQVVARLVREFKDLTYLIVGTGPDESDLRNLARKLGIADFVVFAGYVCDEDLPDYYRACDVFVMPNCEEAGDMEGFGMVFLEANAVGKPVLGGRSGGTKESIKDGVTGYLCDPHDVDAIVAKLRLLLQNPSLRQQIGSQASAWVRSEFDWPSRASRLHELSESLVEAHRRRTQL
jgi:phosphatidylinositol alpha-1,6-mannosyltransferase